MLVVSPFSTWEKISLDRDNFLRVLFLFFTPLVLACVAVEVAGLIYLQRPHDQPMALNITPRLAYTYGICEAALTFLVVFLFAAVVRTIAKTFHRRNTFTQTFSVAAHSMGPFILVRMMDALPFMSPWATFGIAIVLSLSTLYHGIPPVLEPDPPSAFGTYFMSAVMLTMFAALAQLIGHLVLSGTIRVHI